MTAARALGVLPTQKTLVLERFFDESGGMQLVLHAPFGSRINKAWGLALRKRFCRQFNFELQAAATEDGLLLSLGPQHSFPLADVFRYLHSATARDVLVQAFLDAPVFQTRWRWNTTISLAVPRNRHGKKVAPQLQRMMADDLMAAAFPDAAACIENIPGDREIPDHPLVAQAVRDCLQEAMDFDGLAKVLDRIHRGELTLVARDTTEPSPLCHELLNARPYAFLDDAPLEERRAHAVYTRRAGEPGQSRDLAALDDAAIARVCEEQRPDPRDADELHDVLLTAGYLLPHEAAAIDETLFAALSVSRRARDGGGRTRIDGLVRRGAAARAAGHRPRSPRRRRGRRRHRHARPGHGLVTKRLSKSYAAESPWSARPPPPKWRSHSACRRTRSKPRWCRSNRRASCCAGASDHRTRHVEHRTARTQHEGPHEELGSRNEERVQVPNSAIGRCWPASTATP